MPARTLTLIALALSALALTACGDAGPAVRERTGAFTVTLDDYLIRPQNLRVPKGRELTITVTNHGRLGHTFRIRSASGRNVLALHDDRARRDSPAADVRPRRRPLPDVLRARQPRGTRHVRHPDGGLRQMDAIEPLHFRAVMGNFATGVTVVTASGPAGPVGMTANAVCSLSLDPLLLLVCFDNDARTLRVVREQGRFGVNVLAAGQEELARLFASKAPERAKFANVEHTVHDGIPVIEGTLAWVGCTLQQLIPGGDHTIGIGAVTAAETASAGDPLVWHRGEYR